ncbi:MAG: hypothetical protein RIS79_3871 [Verrucomicrobiota bacterium]
MHAPQPLAHSNAPASLASKKIVHIGHIETVPLLSRKKGRQIPLGGLSGLGPRSVCMTRMQTIFSWL